MKVVVLGRDGVINALRDEPILSVDQWEPLPGALDAIAQLTRNGFHVVVATNQQPGDDGSLDVESIHDVHQTMLRLTSEAGGRIDAVFFAPSGNPKSKGKRQPKASLLKQIAERYGLECSDLVMIGDSREDLEGAAACGARTVLVRTGSGDETLGHLAQYDGVTVHADLSSAVDALVALDRVQ